MKLRLGSLLFVMVLGMAMLAATVMAVGSAADLLDAQDEETAREQAEAAAAETAAPATSRNSSLVTTTTITAPLFAGVNVTTIFAQAIDPETSAATPLFDGVEVWGAAYDRQTETVYMSDGTELVAWPIGGTPTSLGTMFAGETTTTSINFVGLAFYNGTLYGTRNIANGPALPEAVYTIDTTTLEATLAFTYSIGADAADIGGFDAHPFTGVLYGTNDDTDLQGLVQLDPDGTVSLIAPYPAGQTDIDGLAVGSDNRAYLVTDEPGFFYVFDFDTMTYTAPITSPWTTAELFAGGAWVTDPITPALTLTKTVGLDPNACAATDEMAVISGTLVTYCYEVMNTGNVELNIHDLTDSELGTLLSDFPYKLEPAASVFLTQTAAITQTTVNTATWTAFNAGPLDVISATDTARLRYWSRLSPVQDRRPGSQRVRHRQRVDGRDGTEVTYCYHVTNTGDVTLTQARVWLTRTSARRVTGRTVVLSPTETFFVTDTLQITQTIVNTATWTAYNVTPADGAMATAVATVTLGLPTLPEIEVSPLQLTESIMEDEVITTTLTISNTGDLPLTWTITEATPTCATPAGLAWVESDPPAGTTAPGGASSVVVTFGATGLPVADYAGSLCVSSNDADEPVTEVGLSLAITEPPRYLLYIPAGLGSPEDDSDTP